MLGKIHKVILLSMVCLLGVCGCQSSNLNKNVNHKLTDYVLKDGEMFLYNIPLHRMGTYNLNDNRFCLLDETANLFQYSFIDGINFVDYISGHSIENDFCFLKSEGNRLNVVQSFDQNTQVFPFARYKKDYMYLLQSETKSGWVSDIAKMEQNQMESICSIPLKIKKGVFIGDHLYFTVYQEASDSFNLYEADMAGEPEYELVEEGLVSDDIYCHNDELLISDNDKIYSHESTYQKMFFNQFLEDGIHLFQISIDDAGDMQCWLTNLENNHCVVEQADVINYAIEPGQIIVYAKNKILKMPLN